MNESHRDRLIEAALDANAHGWAVFPLASRSKKPQARSGGFKDATHSREHVEAAWRRTPEANIGIATGEPSRIWVLDIDPRHGGLESLRALEDEYGPLPTTVTVATPSGGKHLCFAYSKEQGDVRNRAGVLPGIDVRGDDGYVAGVGSVHPNGGIYYYAEGCSPDEVPLAPAPEWLLDLVTAPVRKGHSETPTDGAIPEGARNSTLASLAGSMRRRGLSEAAIRAALHVTNEERCEPLLSQREVEAIARSISGYDPADLVSVRAPFGRSVEAVCPARFVPVSQYLAEAPPDPDWVIRGFLARDVVTLLTGKWKESGKSTLVMHWVRAILRGEPFLDHTPPRGSVIYLTEEAPTTFRQLVDRVGIGDEEGLHVLGWQQARNLPWTQVVQLAVEAAQAHSASLVVIDTWSKWTGIRGDSEKNAGDVLEAFEAIEDLRAKTGAAVLILHHPPKRSTSLADAGRGSGALGGAVDLLLLLKREPQRPDNVRTLEAEGRLGEATPSRLALELTDRGYVSLGSGLGLIAARVKLHLPKLLRNSPEEAMTVPEIVKALNGNARSTTVKDVLAELVADGRVQRVGEGKRGSPGRFWVQLPDSAVAFGDASVGGIETPGE